MSMPNVFRKRLSTDAMPMPPTKPSPDAINPMMTDSTSRAETIWMRLAPTARSNAFSRWRWATIMENVL